MQFRFTYAIDEAELSQHIAFFKNAPFNTLEQHPLWWRKTQPEKTVCYFSALENSAIVCSGIVEENGRLGVSSANIQFGPIAYDPEILIQSISSIANYYRKKKFTQFSVQLGMITGSEADYVEYSLYKQHAFKTYFDRENWSSLMLDLQNEEEQLLRNMSKGHKSDIKKAGKLGMKTIEDFTPEQFDAFIEIYTRMHYERKLPQHPQGSDFYLRSVLGFFKEFKTGTFILVADSDGKILGGVALAFQQSTVRYLKGASDPAIRNLPILHLALWEGIRKAKANGFKYFDFWGYNHFVGEADQLFFINRFKKGFGGKFIFYPKKMYFVFKPFQFQILRSAKKLYKKLR